MGQERRFGVHVRGRETGAQRSGRKCADGGGGAQKRHFCQTNPPILDKKPAMILLGERELWKRMACFSVGFVLLFWGGICEQLMALGGSIPTFLHHFRTPDEVAGNSVRDARQGKRAGRPFYHEGARLPLSPRLRRDDEGITKRTQLASLSPPSLRPSGLETTRTPSRRYPRASILCRPAWKFAFGKAKNEPNFAPTAQYPAGLARLGDNSFHLGRGLAGSWRLAYS
jgi:hypothetical protein